MLVELQKGDSLAFFLVLVPSLSFSCPTASWPLAAAHIFPMPLHSIRKKIHQIVCSTAENTLLLILYLYPGPILGSKSSQSSRINICNSQRLYSISTAKKNSWLEPKFPTECFFMAIEAHHLALLPACRRHSRRQRAHRDLTRMIEHLESHESDWMETPMASRNKSLLKKWREQIKVLPGFVF